MNSEPDKRGGEVCLGWEEVAWLTVLCQTHNRPKFLCDIELLAAENRRYREALEKISVDGCGCSGYCHCTSDGGIREEFLRIWKEEAQSLAKEALNAGTGGGK